MMRVESLCMLLLVGCLVADVSGTLSRQAAGATTGPTKAAVSRVLSAHTSAMSCSRSSAVSYGGVAKSWAESNAVSLKTAATACAHAVAENLGKARANCKKSNVYTFIQLSAEACARATLKLRASTLAGAMTSTTGHARASRASSESCGLAAGVTEAIADATASAVASAFTESTGKVCDAFTNTEGEAAVRAIARAITSGFASSHSSANSRGNGRSEATGYALFQGDVGVYAKAIGRFVARACNQCGGHCSFCEGLEHQGEAESTTDSFTIAAKGEFALASAMSDAMASVCEGKVNIRAAVKAMLKAHAQVCMQLTAKAWGKANSAGTATACTNNLATGNASALAKAYGDLWANAAARATKGHECETNAFSEVTATVLSKLSVIDFVKATGEACAKTDDDHAYVSVEYIAEIVSEGEFERFGNTTADAVGGALAACECKGAGYCCNCDTRKCHW